MRAALLASVVLAAAAVASPARALTVFALVNTGEVYASPDTGATWSVKSTLPVRDAVALTALRAPTQIMITTRSGVFYRSADGGTSWTARAALPAHDIAAVVVNPYDGLLLALTASGTVYASTDTSYTTFAAKGVLPSACVGLAVALGGVAQTHYALTRTGEVYRSLDGGATWTARGAIPTSEAVGVRVFGPTLAVTTASGDIYTSGDDAATWTAVGTLSAVHVTGWHVVGPYVAAVLAEGELYTSLNGVQWNLRGTVNQVAVQALATDTPGVTGIGEPVRPAIATFDTPAAVSRRGEPLTLRFGLAHATTAAFALFDIEGRVVARRAAESFTAGAHAVVWPAGLEAAGVYVLRLTAADGTAATQRRVAVP